MRSGRVYAVRLVLFLGAVLAVSSAAPAQQQALAPHSMYEPPAAKAAASLAVSGENVPADLLTTGEKTQWRETGTYAEVVELMGAMERGSPLVKRVQFGTTSEGRPMYALIVSSDRAFTPAAAAKTGKAVILIQSGIHAGEIEGKDTVLMLIRDMTATRTRSAWLDHAIFVVIPVFNGDGHDQFSPYHRMSQNGPRLTVCATPRSVSI